MIRFARPVALGFAALVCLSCTIRTESGEIHNDSATSAGGGYKTTRWGDLKPTVVRLAGGDSVELQSTGPALVTGKPTGLLVTYYPYFDLADTDRVRSTALALFDALRLRLRSEPAWMVLRAADRPASERNQGGIDHFYGVVLERRDDHRWYPLDGAQPVR